MRPGGVLHRLGTIVRDIGDAGDRRALRWLWKVEESFRISNHNLKVRPIFHWMEPRIRAHLTISFMALACVHHLCWRLGLQESSRMSPEWFRRIMLNRQGSVFKDTRTWKRYALPSRPSVEAEAIYRNMGLPLSCVP